MQRDDKVWWVETTNDDFSVKSMYNTLKAKTVSIPMKSVEY